MIEKNELLDYVSKLLKSAKNRKTEQGVKVYEGVLKKNGEVLTQSEIDDLARKLKHALAGIEAHGHFTSEEFEIVKGIRSMR